MERKNVYVYSDWHTDATPQLMGELQIQIVRRKEIFAFEFNPAWLKSNDTRILDPDLQLFAGPQYAAGNKNNFGQEQFRPVSRFVPGPLGEAIDAAARGDPSTQ